MAKETAEQKLLRLIEQNDEAPSTGEVQGSSSEAQELLSAVQNVGGTVAVPPALAEFINTLKSFLSKSSRESFGIRQFNYLLIIILLICISFFISNIFFGIKIANTSINFTRPDSVEFSSENLLPSIPDLQQYVSVISFRNIFHPFEKKAPEVVKEESDIPVLPQQLADKTKALKLVGISWLDTPESASAMVENTETGITYFLRTGEQVNGVGVKTIYANSVVLELNGQQMEMKLQ